MAAVKRWNVDIVIDENEEEKLTQAEARLMPGNGVSLRASGSARRNPHDINVPEIGDELAAARALSSLAHRLLRSAAADIEVITHEPVEPVGRVPSLRVSATGTGPNGSAGRSPGPPAR